jgi:hypothetical protein
MTDSVCFASLKGIIPNIFIPQKKNISKIIVLLPSTCILHIFLGEKINKYFFVQDKGNAPMVVGTKELTIQRPA